MAVQCVLVGKGKDDVFTAVYGETTFDKVLKAYNENKVVQVIYQNRIYYLDNTTVIDSPEAFSFISAFSNQNDETGEIKHYVISLMTGDSWSGPFLQNSTPATHANTHAKDGTDPLTPADRLGRNYSEILEQRRIITKVLNVDIKVIDMPLLDTSYGDGTLNNFIADLVLQILSFQAEQERICIKQRQAEGIAAAKQKGVKFGRPRKQLPSNFEDLYYRYLNNEPVDKLSKDCKGLSKSTLRLRLQERHSKDKALGVIV